MLPIQCQGKSSYPCSSFKAGASKAYPQIRSENPGGRRTPISDGDACRKTQIKPPRETNVGEA